MLSWSIYHKRSTVQSALHKSSKARTCRSERDNASKQSWRQPACRRAFTELPVFSKPSKKSNLPGLKKYTAPREAADLVCCANYVPLFPILILGSKIQHCSFSPSFLCISYMHATSGLFSWSMELSCHLQGVSLRLKSWTSLSASFILVLVLFSLVSERTGWRKTPAERSLACNI